MYTNSALNDIPKGAVPYLYQCTLYESDGTSIALSTDDIMDGSASFEWSIADESSFSLGTACVSSFAFRLNNFEDKFTNFTWDGSYIDVSLAYTVGGNVVAVPQGRYYLYSHKTLGNAIQCQSFSILSVLDKTHLGTVAYPKKAYQIATSILAAHNITLGDDQFHGYNTDIVIDPDVDMTHRQALMYIAQLCGCYLFTDRNNVVWFKEYTATQSMTPEIEVFSIQDIDVAAITLTGLDVSQYDGRGVHQYRPVVAQPEYNLTISDNPYIVGANADDVCQNYANAIGLTTITGSVSAFFNPAVEVGDIADLTDSNGNTIPFYVTNIVYKVGAIGATYICSMDSQNELDFRPKPSAQAEAVARIANQKFEENKQWFWHDDDGAHVLGATDGYQTDISTQGMTITSLADEAQVAQFTQDGVVVGRDDRSQIAMDFSGFRFQDMEGNVVAGIRLDDTEDTAQQTYTGASWRYRPYTVSRYWTGLSVAVTVTDGGDTHVYEYEIDRYDNVRHRMEYSGVTYGYLFYRYIGSNTELRIQSVASGVTFSTSITLSFYVSQKPYYIFGEVDPSFDASDFGARSMTHGYLCHASGADSFASGGQSVASGQYAHAEGMQSVASGDYSHAEGRETVASGDEAHADGIETEASGAYSHASGWGTIANQEGQFVVGRFNKQKNNTYAFIVGGGFSPDSADRENAFEVQFDGGLYFKLATTHALYTAINSAGWASDTYGAGMCYVRALLQKLVANCVISSTSPTFSGDATKITVGSAFSLYVRKIGKVVTLDMNCTFKTTVTAAGTAQKLATIPSGYRPASAVRAYFPNSAGRTCLIIITTAGEIDFYNTQGDTANSTYRMNFTWITS